jgi:ribonuclease P protein component
MPDRVRTRRQFALFLTPTGRGQSGPLRILFVAGDNGVAAAYAINRKVGNAVVRNKIRRRLRALMDEISPRPLSGKYLIRVGIETSQLTYDELRHHLTNALQRANRT